MRSGWIVACVWSDRIDELTNTCFIVTLLIDASSILECELTRIEAMHSNSNYGLNNQSSALPVCGRK